MTGLQKRIYTVGFVFYALAAFIGIVTAGMVTSVVNQGGGTLGFMMANIISAVALPIISLLFLIVVRAVGAQSESIAPEVVGLIWFGIGRELFSLVVTFAAQILFTNAAPGGNVTGALMINSYGQQAISVASGIGLVLAVAAMGMQIYEKKMTVSE